MLSKSYFQIVERPIKSEDAHSLFYNSSMPHDQALFKSINSLQPNQVLYPGQMLVAPSFDGISDASARGFEDICTEQNFYLRNNNSSSNPALINSSGPFLRFLTRESSREFVLSNIDNGIDSYVKQLDKVAKHLSDLNKLYIDGLKETKNLKTPAFLYARKSILGKIKADLPRFSSSQILANSNAPSMKDAIGISTKSLINTAKTSGNPIEVKAISDSISKTSKLTSNLKTAGTVLKIIDIGTAGLETYGKFESDGAQAGFATMGTKAAGLAGGMAASSAVVGLVMLTGPVGVVGLGVGLLGAAVAGYAGKQAAEWAAEESIAILSSGAEQAIDYILEP